MIKFKDTGTGIVETDMEKLFSPFFSTKDKNMGLGLAIAQQIVLAHDGRIDIESEKGKGSEFIVTLPEV